MQYMLMIYEDQQTYADAEAYEAILRQHQAFAGELAQAGVIRGGSELKEPETATTLRKAGGRYAVHDGPFAETKEQLGGYYLIEAPDLDAAIAWARKLPMAGDGAVEVRPLADAGEARELEREQAAAS